MSNMIRLIFLAGAGFLAACPVTQQAVGNGQSGAKQISWSGKTYALYPASFKERPDIPSPCRAEDGMEVLTARTDRKSVV